MRAAVATAFDKPLTIEERPIPDPGPGQVLVRVETCGLCHTDIHAVHGDWPVKPPLPLVPGHEGVGIVERLGEGVTSRTVGQRVAMPWLGHACGECRYCVDGRENLCEQQYNTGYAVDGSYAEYMLADARFAVPVPSGVSAMDAAPLTWRASRPTPRSRPRTWCRVSGSPCSASAGSDTSPSSTRVSWAAS